MAQTLSGMCVLPCRDAKSAGANSASHTSSLTIAIQTRHFCSKTVTLYSYLLSLSALIQHTTSHFSDCFDRFWKCCSRLRNFPPVIPINYHSLQPVYSKKSSTFIQPNPLFRNPCWLPLKQLHISKCCVCIIALHVFSAAEIRFTSLLCSQSSSTHSISIRCPPVPDAFSLSLSKLRVK